MTRVAGIGCQVRGRKVCRRNAFTTVGQTRMCALHAADALFAAQVRDSDGGGCWVRFAPFITCNGAIQCAHVLSRRYRSIRWEPQNARPLCAAHHIYYTHHPLEWEEACRHAGVPWDTLRWRALNEPPMDPEQVVAELEAA